MARRREKEILSSVCPDCGEVRKHSKACPQRRQIPLPSERSEEKVEEVLVEARPMIDFGPGHSAWKDGGTIAADERYSGAFVRLRPPPHVGPEWLEGVRKFLEVSGAVVKVVLPSKRAVLPKAEEPRKREVVTHREIVGRLVEESNSGNKEALRALCEEVMGKVGM